VHHPVIISLLLLLLIFRVGLGNYEIGSKNWLDSILSGLAARHLKPPAQQVKMLVQNEATLTRLKKATELKQQLDIICGAAYRAQLGRQKVSSDSTGSSTSGAQSSNNTPVGPPPEPKVQSWRLRPRDWQSAKPASAAEPITGDRQDVFRTNVEGDPLLQVWSRVCVGHILLISLKQCVS